MASGNRRLRINTQERAVSSDINRLQQFQNQDFDEFLRLLLNVGTSDDDPGVYDEASTLGTPLSAEVINGLLVRPIAGSFALTVDPGILGAIAPDAAADDSNYKFVRDPGIPAAGVIAIGPNASGSIRIDVIECRVNPVEATVSDSRDIFDPSTGLFSATSVTKEIKGQLEYRVRAGVGGSGYPAAVNGWLPLCVASVPNGAPSNDTVTFWDVRPMIADRQGGPMNDKKAQKLVDCDFQVRRVDATHVPMEGSFHAVVLGRRVGGSFLNGVPGTSAILDLADVANQDTGTIAEPIATSELVFVYCATPFGLPRWARYTDGPSGRVPHASKGILIVSKTVADYDGSPMTAIGLPAGTGLGSTTSDAICVALSTDDGGGQFAPANCSNKVVQTFAGISLAGAYAVLDPGSVDFHVTDAFWPRNVKAIWANFQVTLTIAGGASNAISDDVLAYPDDSGAASDATIAAGRPEIIFNHGGGPAAYLHQTGVVRVQLPNQKPGSGTPLVSPRYIKWNLTNTGLTTSTLATVVTAYEL